MKKLIKAGFLFGLIFLMAQSAWALLIVQGDTVTLDYTDGSGIAKYKMTEDSSTYDWDHYYTFCLESQITFNPDGNSTTPTIYTVQSVADYATSGGIDNAGPYNDAPDWDYFGNGNPKHDNEIGKDYVSDQTKWLFATYLTDPTAFNANDVQNAIWWLEDEPGTASNLVTENDWTNFFSGEFGKLSDDELTSFLAGWDIKAVNLVLNCTDIQSQLVGKELPVPEPATMILLGIGLLGIAGMGRKRTNN